MTLGRSARPDRAADGTRSATRHGAEAILPFCYGGSNGLLTQDTDRRRAVPRVSARRGSRARSAPRRPAPRTRPLYGKMPGVSYARLRAREADRALGRQPVGVRHPPRAVHPRGAGNGRHARRRRSPRDAARAAAPICTSRFGPAPTCRLRSPLHRYLFETRPRRRAVPRRAHARRRRTARARRGWTIERAAAEAGIDPAALETFARAVRAQLAGARPLRLGARAQPQRRQRRCRGSRAAGRRRQIRRSRRRIHDEQLHAPWASRPRHWMNDTPEPPTRTRQHESPRARADSNSTRSAGRDAVRLQLQSAGDHAGSEPRASRD